MVIRCLITDRDRRDQGNELKKADTQVYKRSEYQLSSLHNNIIIPSAEKYGATLSDHDPLLWVLELMILFMRLINKGENHRHKADSPNKHQGDDH